MIQVEISSNEPVKQRLICNRTTYFVVSNYRMVWCAITASCLSSARFGIDLFCPPVVLKKIGNGLEI